MSTAPIRPVASTEALKARLDHLALTFDLSTVTPDPLELVLRYADAGDQEIVGLIAAAFAYGRADIVVRNVGRALEPMGASPRKFLLDFDRRRHGPLFRGFVHRFQKTTELLDLFECISLTLNRYGSLEAAFMAGDDGNGDISEPLHHFVTTIIRSRRLPAPRRRALSYLLTSPRDGSACKRMNLFLRWMVRRTPPDPGIWLSIDPSRLVIPLDTHVHRITRFLGINERASADWKTARQLTDELRRFDPADPVRYDFAICRLGILDLCSRRRKKEHCSACLLRDVCRFPVT